MKFTFLFSSGPLDGNAFHFDTDHFQSGDSEFGGKAWLDTHGGTVGRQFTISNPFTPPDNQGTVYKFRKHVYEVTAREERSGKQIVSAKHICALGDRRSPAYAEKFADFIKACESKEADVMVIAMPEALGDNYEELIESLNRLANANKQLSIVPRSERH